MLAFWPSKKRCQDCACSIVARDLLFQTPHRVISSNTAFWRNRARKKRFHFLVVARMRKIISGAVFGLILMEETQKWCPRKRENKMHFFTFSVLELLPLGLYLRQSTSYRVAFFTDVLRIECSTNAVSFIEIWELFCMRDRDPVDTPSTVSCQSLFNLLNRSFRADCSWTTGRTCQLDRAMLSDTFAPSFDCWDTNGTVEIAIDLCWSITIFGILRKQLVVSPYSSWYRMKMIHYDVKRISGYFRE